MEKIRYEVDPQNRLVVTSSGLYGLRKVLDGNFRISDQNSLTYHIKAPVPQGIKAPYQVKLKGSWSLTENHDLRFTLDKWKTQSLGDELTLQGEIIAVNKDSLVFAVTTRTKEGNQSVYILKLTGSWQADENNRLTFSVKKENAKYDILTLDGIWEIGKNYQIIYRYQKTQLKRRLKRIHTLVFKGGWRIKDKTQISYLIEASTDSGFNFKTSLGIFKDKYIKYELGIGTSRRIRPLKRTLILFGSWKIKEQLGLVFEVEYAKRKIDSIIFGAEARLTDKDTILFKLKNQADRAIGGQLELAHKILKGEGQVFLRLLKTKAEAAIFAGAGWRW